MSLCSSSKGKKALQHLFLFCFSSHLSSASSFSKVTNWSDHVPTYKSEDFCVKCQFSSLPAEQDPCQNNTRATTRFTLFLLNADGVFALLEPHICSWCEKVSSVQISIRGIEEGYLHLKFQRFNFRRPQSKFGRGDIPVWKAQSGSSELHFNPAAIKPLGRRRGRWIVTLNLDSRGENGDGGCRLSLLWTEKQLTQPIC